MLGNRKSQHSFAQVPEVHTARSRFDRSFTRKTTFDFDYLIPIMVDEIIPGDTANLTVNAFARLATQIKPIMDNLYVDFFFFFVPNRLVWTNWEKFCGAQDNPGDTTDYTIPICQLRTGSGMAVGTIYDYMGIPTQVDNLDVNALPLRAYYLIWNTWFRDQNLQNSLTVSTDNGPDADTEYTLQKRGKRHDYFTSALPWPQKGTAVDLPLGTSAPVLTDNTAIRMYAIGRYTSTDLIAQGSSSNNTLFNTTNTGANAQVAFGDNTGLYADLSTATAATINQLREAWQIQSILELDARGGTRYVEILLSHYNVVSPDFRLQRPEYLGGGEMVINSHVVPQTSPTSGANAQAQLAAFSTASSMGKSIGFTKSFVEHGYIIGLACARADITYQQGLERMWTRSTRFDFFWPKLQQIGEQAIRKDEIYAQGTAADDDAWGYQERYAEYRYKPSQITGEFRSTYATSLDMYHMAEEFGSLPSLNSTFIVQNTPVDRALAVSGEVHLIMDMWFQYIHARPMLTYSVPSVLGKF